ncbi:hypothetical protein [Limnohabitans sp. 15K]|uniref:hypothetical protein n=1 Tax=Limnohabitans sp. 15K TaxID=1100706 RepID=UPI00117A37DA|nr:hypothetical protein [Limnohabitans sp. 15K]
MNEKNTLFFKGISGFTARSHFEILERAAVSPYRWWFEALRCSKDYWWVCKQKGKTLDPDLKQVWQAFGDVLSKDFAGWWIDTGFALFQEQMTPPKIERVDEMSLHEHLRNSERMLLSIPTNISEKTLKRQFLELIREIEDRKIRKGDAQFRLLKVKGIRMKVLESAVRVWHMRSMLDYEMTHPSTGDKPIKMDLYDIGAELGISPLHKRRAGEPLKDRILKERVMRVAVIRMTNRAEALIANAEIGQFPSYEAVKSRKRWTNEQKKAMDKAVDEGKWSPPGISEINWNRLRQRYVRGAIW